MALLVLMRPSLRSCWTHKIQMASTLASLRSPQLLFRSFASEQRSSKALAEARQSSEVSQDVRPLGEKIKEGTKTASYTAVILIGVGVTGMLFYVVFRELFSSTSPNNVYSEALDKCKIDTRVQDSLGAPIKGFGEETRRRRRGHVAHLEYQLGGKRYMRMQFYIQGVRNKATVHLEMVENDSGKFDYRYLIVQLDYYPHTTIIIEDNRLKYPLPSSPSSQSQQQNLSF